MSIDKSSLQLATSYPELRRKSELLAAGVESMADRLPPVDGDAYCARPSVKWVFVAVDERFESWSDEDGEVYRATFSFCRELFADMSVCLMREEYGSAIWIWEEVRPSLSWLDTRLPQMYLLSYAIGCHFGGWTFEDECAWELGLGKLIDMTCFDERVVRPGQSS